MSVDIAASVGSCVVQGDHVTAQAGYVVPPHTAKINEAIATADGTNPRLDQVVLEMKDDAHDASGLNQAQVRVIAGTPTAGATLDNRSGAAALPSSAMRLADVLVAAGDTSITDAEIRDRRTRALRLHSVSIATEESRTNTAYGLLGTPDVVRDVVLPADSLLRVSYKALWKESVAGAARAAIHLGSNALKRARKDLAAPDEQSADLGGTTNTYSRLVTYDGGLASFVATVAQTGDVTTGQLIGYAEDGADANATLVYIGSACPIFAAAGTYDVSVQFKASSGSVTAKERRLWVEVIPCA